MKRVLWSFTVLSTFLLIVYGATTMELPNQYLGISTSKLPGLYEQKSWGFVRSKDEKPPEITAWQQEMLRESSSLFRKETTEKIVALTFDMGYEEPGCTPALLNTLEKHQAKACFFVTGHYLKSQPELAKQIVEQGHILGNHTWNHKNLAKLDSGPMTDEIMKWHNHVQGLTGHTGKYLRPPEGVFTRNSLQATKELGYQTVFWSVAIKDWNPMPNPQEVVTGVVKQLHPGAVILLHGNSKDVSSKLDELLTAIKEKGYSFVTLDELQK